MSLLVRKLSSQNYEGQTSSSSKNNQEKVYHNGSQIGKILNVWSKYRTSCQRCSRKRL